MDKELKEFNKNAPTLEDYENKLKQFEELAAEVNEIDGHHQIGALSLKTDKVKGALLEWIEKWKYRFSKDLHKKAKTSLNLSWTSLSKSN